MSLTKISTKAPQPYMNSAVAPYFEELRKEVYEKSGVDFLSKCGDVFRDASLRTNKTGVAFKSNHKTGRAFDYDQANPNIVVIQEPIGGKMFFRTYLKCSVQDGTKGFKTIKSLHERRGWTYTGYVIDFTYIAEKHGFVRIPARTGWQHIYNDMEFWHYQKMDGLTWEQAMAQIKGSSKLSGNSPSPTPAPQSLAVYRLNSTGTQVSKIQFQLTKKGFPTNVDGIFGVKTKANVIAFQKTNGLTADGVVGKDTLEKLYA